MQQAYYSVTIDDEAVAGLRRHLSDGDFYFALPVASVSAPLIAGLGAGADAVPYWDLTLHLQRYALSKDARRTNEDFLWYATRMRIKAVRDLQCDDSDAPFALSVFRHELPVTSAFYFYHVFNKQADISFVLVVISYSTRLRFEV